MTKAETKKLNEIVSEIKDTYKNAHDCAKIFKRDGNVMMQKQLIAEAGALGSILHKIKESGLI